MAKRYKNEAALLEDFRARSAAAEEKRKADRARLQAVVSPEQWKAFESYVYEQRCSGHEAADDTLFLRHFGLSWGVRLLEAANLDPDNFRI